MSDKVKTAFDELLEDPEISLTRFERHVLRSIRDKNIITRDTESDLIESRTFGERLSDQIASIGGSWPFIISFAAFMTGWIVLNSRILARSGESFDPYPYILLNLVLSMTTAIQAPVIMMSQNRQAEKDRRQAANDYEVNLKAELEIHRLHEKLDELQKGEWNEMLEIRERKLRLSDQLNKRADNQDP